MPGSANDPRILHFAVFPVSDDPIHLANLSDSRMKDYPDNLNMPVLCIKDEPKNRWVIPTLLTLAFSAGRVRNADPRRQPAELFSRLREESMVWGVSAAWRDASVVPEWPWVKAWRWARQEPLPAVDEQQVIGHLSDAIVEAYLPQGKCIDAPEPPEHTIQVTFMGAIPMNMPRNWLTDQSWHMRNSALALARAKLLQNGSVFPRGAEHDIVVSPIFTASNRTGFVRIPVIRVWPCKGIRVRDLIPFPKTTEAIPEDGHVPPRLESSTTRRKGKSAARRNGQERGPAPKRVIVTASRGSK